MAGRLHPGCPCPEEPVETSGVRANLQDHCFPIACALETSPLPPTHSFLGLTSFLRWLGLHLLGFLAPNGAQRQHGDSTGAPCRRETVSAWRWSRGPGCGFQRSGGLRQPHPLPTSPGPQHPRGRAGNATLLVSSKAQCGLLTSAPASPWVGLGQYVWGETWGISACQSLAGDLKI